MAHPPAHTQILVVGGGPSGSYAASTLAREGFQVVLFEAASFPRYHVGESLIPAVRHHLRFIDAEEKVVKAGFARKPGAAMKFTQHKHEGYTDFVAIGANNSVWNVKRADFDKLLLDHSGEQGASVFQQTKVTAIEFNDENRPVAATYTSGSETPADDDAPQSQRKITFDYLIDASGRAGIMSTRYLKTRKFNSALRNIATWGYWRNAGIYGKGTRAEGAAWFEALTDESGWAWFIPLAGGLASVGLVRAMKSPPPPSSATNRFTNPPSAPQTPPAANATAGAPSTPQGRTSPDSPGSVQSSGSSNAPSTAPTTPATANEPKTPPSASRSPNDGSSSTTRQRYLAGLSLAPGLLELLGPGAEMMVGDSDIVSSDDVAVRSTSDFSYSATSYAGPGYRIVGDAGAFIDPFFSSGIHLAMNSALSASASVAAIIRGDCTEDEAAEWHSARVSTSYTRFLVVVLSAYKQMRSQKEEVLTDVGEESFDNAFKALRPVIHGNADVGPRLSEQEVQQTLDFCSDLFTPTSPEQHAALQARVAASEKMAQQSASNPDDQAPQAEDTPSTNGEGKQTGTIDRMLQWLRVSEPTSPGDNGVASSLRSRAAAAAPGLTDKLFNIRAPVLAPRELDEAVASLLPAADIGTPAEEEARRVLSKINARRVIHRDFGGMHSLEEEALGAGLSVRLERGRLGLLRTKTDVAGSVTA